jgi:hypothetical protein
MGCGKPSKSMVCSDVRRLAPITFTDQSFDKV